LLDVEFSVERFSLSSFEKAKLFTLTSARLFPRKRINFAASEWTTPSFVRWTRMRLAGAPLALVFNGRENEENGC